MENKNPCLHCAGTGFELPNILKTLRERDHLKGNQVADRLGITQSAYSRLETAAGRPGGLRWCKHLRALSDLYRVTTDQLLGREPLAAPAAKKNRPQRPPDRASLAKSAAARKAISRKNRSQHR